MTTKPDILRTHKLKLRTVTPVSIGADEADALSPYADYVIDGDQIILLDHRRMEQAVREAGLLDEYVTGIGDSMEQNPNRSGFSLSKFIRERLKKSPRELALRILPNRGIEQHRKQSVAAIVKDAGRAYLPGSSIKGALRTAMLYDWLVNDKDSGKEELDKYHNALPKLLDARKEVKQKDEDCLKKGIFDKKRKRISLTFEENRLFGELKDAERNLEKEAKKFFIEANLFGKLEEGPESRFIRVTDSTFVPPEAVGIYGIKRIRLQPNPKSGGRRENEMPTPREALFSATPLEFKIDIVPAFAKDSSLAYWAEKSTGELLQLLNNFTLDCIGNELYELRQADHRDFQRYIERMEDFYADLQNRAQNGSIFIRLGFGKTRYDNSLALSFFNGMSEDKQEDAFLDYRRGMWGVHWKKANYPVTRTVTAKGEPLGWVEVMG